MNLDEYQYLIRNMTHHVPRSDFKDISFNAAVHNQKYGEACLLRIFCRLLNKCKPLFDYLYNIYMNT